MCDNLRFLGRGSAFSDENNSSFFTHDNELVFIDLPMSSFHKIRNIGPYTLAEKENAELTVIVTHTHGDHIGGLSTLIHYAYYILHTRVTVIAPSAAVKQDLLFLIEKLEGCCPEAYSLMTADEAKRPWLLDVIPTRHTPQLEGRCFGYHLSVYGKDVVYTGDTATIEPFLPYLKSGTYLYSDCSSYTSQVHISITELIEKTRGLDIRLYLMHLDDPEKILDEAKGSGAVPAPLYEIK